jgi:outer membrane protein assembly factor BamA
VSRIAGYVLLSLFFLQALVLLPPVAHAQNAQPSVQLSDSTEKVVRRLNFKGNDNVSATTLEMLIRTQTNREFLGIPGFTPWYYIHRLTDESFGEEPALLNYQTIESDMDRITRYYNSIGYLQASADTSIVEFERNRVRVTFLIDEGKRSSLQTIAYSGMPDSAFADQKAKNNFYRNSPLTKDQINDSTYQTDSPYLEGALDKERGRIVNYLKDNGYAAVQRDSVTAFLKLSGQDEDLYDVLYSINPGKSYTFGDLHISLLGPDNDTLHVYQDSDTLQGKPYTLNDKKIYLRKEDAAQTDFGLLTNQLLFEPGNTFSNRRYIRTVNEFQNLGMMTIRQFSLSEDGTGPNYADDEIPIYLTLQTIPKHSISFNVFGLHRYGFGSGAGITYTNNNTFGKAENLQLNLNGSFEYVTSNKLSDLPDAFTDAESQDVDATFFQSFESRVDYSLPRLTFPFARLDDNLFFANSRTRFSLSYSQSDQLLFDINSDIAFNLQYEVNHNERFTSFLDLIELELLDTEPSQPFEDALRQEFDDNPLALQQILEDFRPQFSSVLRYTFRSQRTDLIKRNYGYYSEYSVSFGGNIPYLIDRFFVTPGTIEGQLPSPAKISDNTLAYSQYIKTTADYRRYFPLSNNTVFAARGLTGYALPYGENKTIPLNQRFYAGGSNDVRGWSFFSLGPGAIPLDDVAINGGEIKLLAQTELRQKVLKNFLSSDWILALFTDAGNIWYGPFDKITEAEPGSTIQQPTDTQTNLERGKFKFDEFYKQIAVGSGAGIRLDFDYLVARFDFAFRIHDLQDGWLDNKNLYFHFGIGHSF